MRALIAWTLFVGCSVVSAATAAVSNGELPTIFGDGFEACCTVGGTVAGLAGSGLVLRLTASAVVEDRVIVGNGPWRFATPLAEGAAYAVSVHTQPTSGPQCRIVNPVGTMGHAHIEDIAVYCGDSLQWDAGNWGQLWQ